MENKHLHLKPQTWTHRAVTIWLATCIIYGAIIHATWGYGTGRFYLLSRYHQKIHIYCLQKDIILSSGPWYLPFGHSLGLVWDPLLHNQMPNVAMKYARFKFSSSWYDIILELLLAPNYCLQVFFYQNFRIFPDRQIPAYDWIYIPIFDLINTSTWTWTWTLDFCYQGLHFVFFTIIVMSA